MNQLQDNLILGLPRRPRIVTARTRLNATLERMLEENKNDDWWFDSIRRQPKPEPKPLPTEPQPLEAAIRDYFNQQGYELAFYYPYPRMVKMTFRNNDRFWFVESRVPEGQEFASRVDLEDWLYGHLTTVALPEKLQVIADFLAA